MSALKGRSRDDGGERRARRQSFGQWIGGAAMAAGGVGMAMRGDRLIGPLIAQVGCGPRYVATGDDIPAGHDVSESQRYPNHLLDDHLKKYGGWCEFDIAKNGTTSSTEISG